VQVLKPDSLKLYENCIYGCQVGFAAFPSQELARSGWSAIPCTELSCFDL